jgi:F-type H+-transporting ATPase subunit delta
MPELESNKELKKAVVITAIPLNKAQLKQIQDSINRITSNQFKLTNRVDKSIIAGMYISLENRIIDMTFRSKIEKFKERLSS